MQSPPPRLPSAGGSVRSSVYEFCAAAPKSSRGLGGARELEMGRPAANCPACEQSQVSRTRQGRLERERSDAQACRAGTTATPSRLPGVNGLLLHKSNLMQNVLLLCCEEPPSGRDGEQKIHLKNTKNERRKYLQENKEKLEDYFLPPSTSSFQKLRKNINCHLPGAAVTSLFGSRDLPQASPRTNQCYVGFLLQLWAEPRVTLQAHFYLFTLLDQKAW
jgi:hypothetical protein